MCELFSFAKNIKNTNNLRNANLKQTLAILKLKEQKKRKAMQSFNRNVNSSTSTSINTSTNENNVKIKRLREKVKFAINQLRQEISKQKETINCSLTYIRKACDESIETSIQKQINLLQSQTNDKLNVIL